MQPVRQWSPSFIVAVTLLVAGTVGYIGWHLWRPNDVVASEQVVRRFAGAVAKEVGPLRRKLRRLTGAATMTEAERTAAAKQLEELADDANDRIDQLVEDASSEIEAMDRISVKTQDNRINRIEDRAQEARAAITAAVTEAKQSLDLPP